MDFTKFDCLAPPAKDLSSSLPIQAVRPDMLAGLLAGLPPAAQRFIRQSGFAAKEGSVALVPGAEGVSSALLGLGDAQGPHVFGVLAEKLPAEAVWRFAGEMAEPAIAVLGYCLGAYRFRSLKTTAGTPWAKLLPPSDPQIAPAIRAARASWMVRDLVNMPANLLGPRELAEAASAVLMGGGAQVAVVTAALLDAIYPAIAAVGRGSIRAPQVVIGKWRGSAATDYAKLVSICGKGVCFDTGGYDLKPSSAMLRMKKDMAGAATALGLARMVMEADLPVRLEVRLGCVENSIGGDAMRPQDVLQTRRGLRVEVGNTDAEGRLVLCDLLAEASDAKPDVLIDFATLTGAARTALGPDLPALFSNDDKLAELFLDSGRCVHDPVWRLPLWSGYNSWLENGVGDLNNVSDKPHAGAVTAALFLQRFIAAGTSWLHIDMYGWNDAARPGRPEGGEVQAMRAAFETVLRVVHITD